MKIKFGLMGKIAVSLFVISLIIMILGITVLYTRFGAEAVKMNGLLQESNLEIAGKNIEEKMDAAEYDAISLLFDKELRKILLSKNKAPDQVALHNQVYAGFLRILNTVSVSHIVLYRKDGFSASAGVENDFGHTDYESCMRAVQEGESGFSEKSNYAVWIPVSIELLNGMKEHFFMNARILRDVNSSEPVGILAFYISEKSISEMYSFFGPESYLADADGRIISAQNTERIGSTEALLPDSQAISVPIRDKGWSLMAIPGNAILQRTKSAVFDTGVTAVVICTVLSLTAALLISRGLTRNIKHLKSVMESTGAVKLNARYRGKSRDEVDYLGRTYNQVLDDIRGYIEEDKKKQKQLQTGEIKFLQAQINPHLLYNTLDVAIFYIEKSNMDMALQILRSMSGFFKLSLVKGESFHTIEKELMHINYYMRLQRLCRGKEIELITDIPQEFLELEIPGITLQPIVENAYLHAFAGNINDGWIRIGIDCTEGALRICVMDNGLGIAQDKAVQIEEALQTEKCEGNSYGLWNVFRRLKLCFGDKCTMNIESEFGEYTKVILTIPYKKRAENVQINDD